MIEKKQFFFASNQIEFCKFVYLYICIFDLRNQSFVLFKVVVCLLWLRVRDDLRRDEWAFSLKLSTEASEPLILAFSGLFVFKFWMVSF
jgi:hypothetical protein